MKGFYDFEGNYVYVDKERPYAVIDTYEIRQLNGIRLNQYGRALYKTNGGKLVCFVGGCVCEVIPSPYSHGQYLAIETLGTTRYCY